MHRRPRWGGTSVRAPSPRSGLAAVALTLALMGPDLAAQEGSPTGTGQAGALIDLTGYWVSVVTEDWRWRMLTPPKGDYDSVPLNDEGRRVADAWDLAKDNADGNQCRAFGAAALMRTPTRLYITWDDNTTLRIDSDNGTQTRFIHFAAENQLRSLVAMIATRPQHEATWQGYSVGQWENLATRVPFLTLSDVPQVADSIPAQGVPNPKPRQVDPLAPAPARGGNLKVLTTDMKAGYLRANGVPYSDYAVLTEFFDRFTATNGDEWFVVTSIVDDPQYLTQPFVTTSHFKKEPDGARWQPTPCETPPPTRDSPIESGF